MGVADGRRGRDDDGRGARPHDRDGELTETASAAPAPAVIPGRELGADHGTVSTEPRSAFAAQVGSQRQLPLAEVPLTNYEMVREQGRGGIGIVRRARDRRLDRDVAIKELLRDSHEARVRFEREMRTTAKLQHPGVVPVHEAGCWPDGSPFYAMKLVEGRSLKEVIGDKSSLAERLTLLPNVVAVAETIAYAHSQRVIHRDLKPSNVIIGGYGETVVIDWGLAKDLDEATSPTGGLAHPYRAVPDEGLTVTGQVLGTPAYMPPEQALGAEVDERADVYAVGAILYHVLTGHPPYKGSSSAQVVSAVTSGPPPLIRDYEPSVPHDLAAIAEKAMRRDREDRYASALTMVEDLRRYQAGHLVGAYEYRAPELVARWIGRHRAIVRVSAAAAVVLVAFGVVAVKRVLDAKDREAAQRHLAEQRAANLVIERDKSERQHGEFIASQASFMADRDPARALSMLAQYPETLPLDPTVLSALGKATSAYPPSSVATVADGSAIAISPDSKQVAVASPTGLQILGLPGMEDVYGGPFPGSAAGAVTSVSWGAHGTILVTKTTGNAYVYSDGRLLSYPEELHGVTIQDGALSPDGSIAALALSDGRVQLWRYTTDATVTALNPSGVVEVTFNHEGDRVLSLSTDGVLSETDVTSGHSLALTRVAHADGTALKCSPSGRSCVMGTASGELYGYDWSSHTVTKSSASATSAIIDIKVGDSGGFVASSVDEHVVLAPSGQKATVVPGLGKFIALLPDGTLVAGSAVGTLALLPPAERYPLHVPVAARALQQVQTGGDGSVAVLAGDGTLRYWKPRVFPRTFVLPSDYPTALVSGTSTSCPAFTFATKNGVIYGLEPASGLGPRELTTLSAVGPVFLRPSGETTRLVVAPQAGTVAKLDCATGSIEAQLNLETPIKDARGLEDRVAVADGAGSIMAFSWATKGAPSSLAVSKENQPAALIRWLPDGTLAGGWTNGELFLAENEDGVHGHASGGLQGLVQDPMSEALLVGTADGAVVRYARPSLEAEDSVLRCSPGAHITRVLPGDTDECALALCSDGLVQLSTTSRRITALPDGGAIAMDADVACSRGLIAVATTTAVWVDDLKAGSSVIIPQRDACDDAALTPDGAWLAARCGEAGHVRVWDALQLPLIPRLPGAMQGAVRSATHLYHWEKEERR